MRTVDGITYQNDADAPTAPAAAPAVRPMITTNAEAGTVSVTLSADHFRSIVGWALASVGSDDTLPTLTGVKLELHTAVNAPTHYAADWSAADMMRLGPWQLTAVATDRYRLSFGTAGILDSDAATPRGTAAIWAPVPDESLDSLEPLDILVPGKDLASFVKSLPKSGRYGMTPVVTVTMPRNGTPAGRFVTLSAIGSDGSRSSRTVELLEGEFPKYGSLMPKTIAGPAAVAVNPAYLGALCAAADRYGCKRNVPIRLGLSGEPAGPGGAYGVKPVAVGTHVMDDAPRLSALLMPVRVAQ